MNLQRLILETDAAGNLKQVPKLPPNKQLEVVFSVLEDTTGVAAKRRSPHPEIAGKVEVLGDIMAYIPESDWNINQ